MTRAESDYLCKEFTKLLEVVSTNRSKEFIVSAYDDFLEDEKPMIDTIGIMREAVKSSSYMYDKLEELILYVYRNTENQ